MEWFGIVILAVIAIVVVVRLLSAPIRLAGKLLINALAGFVVLFLLNFVGGIVGLSLGINWINAIVVGILGAPGVVLLLLIKYLV